MKCIVQILFNEQQLLKGIVPSKVVLYKRNLFHAMNIHCITKSSYKTFAYIFFNRPP